MAIRKFLTSVADVYAYDQNDTVVFTGKTLLDSSIEVTLGSAPVRGGRGNQLQYIYYHTGEMKFTLTDTQFNLGFLAATIGKDIELVDDVYVEENVTLTGTGAGSVVDATPLATAGGEVVYGWATAPDGEIYKVTFTGKDFVGAGTLASGTLVCVRYYRELNAGVQSLTIPANILPKVVRLVMETQLNSADVTSNKIGKIQIIAPKVTLSGAFSISMKADGVANTPLTGTALAYYDPIVDAGCTNEPYYARLIEIIDNANWYDNVMALAIEGGDFVLPSGNVTLSVWAIPTAGAAFLAPNADLTFSSSEAGNYTVGTHTGVVSWVANGTSLITTYITAANTIEASCTVSYS